LTPERAADQRVGRLPPNPFSIGGNALYGEHFLGRLDDVRLYNRALTPAEIQADMATGVQ
jgi:hypothetical protein